MGPSRSSVETGEGDVVAGGAGEESAPAPKAAARKAKVQKTTASGSSGGGAHLCPCGWSSNRQGAYTKHRANCAMKDEDYWCKDGTDEPPAKRPRRSTARSSAESPSVAAAPPVAKPAEKKFVRDLAIADLTPAHRDMAMAIHALIENEELSQDVWPAFSAGVLFGEYAPCKTLEGALVFNPGESPEEPGQRRVPPGRIGQVFTYPADAAVASPSRGQTQLSRWEG